MTAINVLLVLASAVTHAVWNLLSKRSASPLPFLYGAVWVAALLNLPLVVASGCLALPRPILGNLLISSVAEAVYLFALARAYRGDLGLAYPLSRGSAPLFIALWSGLFLSERLPRGGYLGIGVLVAAVILASSSQGRRGADASTAAWALVAGVAISVYSIFDKLSLAWLTPLSYNFWSLLSMAVFTTPLIGIDGSWRGAIDAIRTNLQSVALGGALIMVTALLMLAALRTSPASYVGALRGTSVLIGAILARVQLNEELGPRRAVSGVLFVAGTMCLSLTG